MTFGESYWLWVLALVPMLAFVFFTNEKRSRELLQRIVAARLLDRLAGSFSPGRRRLRFAVLLLGIALLIVSMAHPQYGYTWEQSKRRGRDVLIAIDVSKSMLSTDVSPNRLTRARLAAEDLVGALQGDRAGVLAFAGSAFLQAPLTVDYGAVLDSINDLDTNTIPKGGTDIAAVIDEAAKAFGKGESENRCLILFTDGEELTANGVAAAKLHADEFRIFTVGVGTASGAIIPVSSGDNGTEFVKDPEGQIVKSKLDEKRLAEIAEASGGFYTHLEHGAVDMKKIVENGLGKIKEHDIDARMSRHPIERYQWPLGAGILFIAASLLISEKRRVKTRVRSGALKTARAAALLLIFGVMAQPARSEPLNPGVRFYNEKKYKDSYDAFIKQLKHDPDSQALEFDSGAAAYKNGDFDKAIEAFGKASTSTHPSIRAGSEYNLGNALCLRGVKQESKDLRLKDWTNSIQHYNEALKISPQNEDAKYNRDLVQKMIDDLKKEQQQQQNQQQKDDQKDKQDKKDQQKQQNQQNQKDKQQDKNQQQKQDQNSGQGQNKDQQQQQNKDQQQKGDKGQNGQDKDQQKNDQDRNKDQQQQQGGQQGQNKDQQQQNAKNQNKDQQQQQGGQQGQNKDQQQNARNQNKDQQQQQGDQGQDKDQQKKEQNQDQQNGQNPSPDNGNNSNDQQQQASQHPTPGQDEPGKKYSGQIKDAQQGQQQQEGQPGEQEKAYVPGEEREMTAAEAKRIVESEKNEEAKGVLIEHKASAPVLKDW